MKQRAYFDQTFQNNVKLAINEVLNDDPTIKKDLWRIVSRVVNIIVVLDHTRNKLKTTSKSKVYSFEALEDIVDVVRITEEYMKKGELIHETTNI